MTMNDKRDDKIGPGSKGVKPGEVAKGSNQHMALPEGYSPHAVTDSVYDGTGTRYVRPERLDVGLDYVERFLPDGFVNAYEQLLGQAFSAAAMSVKGQEQIDIPGVGKGKNGLGSVRSGMTEVRSVHRSPPRAASSVIGSEIAMQFRSSMDRKIRKITREMRFFLDKANGEKGVNPQRKCSGRCKKFGDGDWMYCPWCGGPMSEIDQEKKRR